MSRILVALLATLFASAASAQLYRWVDQSGTVHYTDIPPQPAASKNVEKKQSTASVIDTGGAPYAVQQAAKSFPVTLYTSASCEAPCKDARDLLAKRGAPFSEVAVTDQKQLDDLKRVSGGDQVPVLVVGKSVVRGFERDSFNGALDGAGYPQNAPRATARAPQAPEPAKPAPEKQASAPVAAEPVPGPYTPR